MLRQLSDYNRVTRLRNTGRPGHARTDGAPAACELVSVITVTYNSAQTIDRTIDSVSAQDYPALEYIVVDGRSTDRTVERLQARDDVIDLWISEQDEGISDAFNKGIALARGKYIALINSDDWMDPGHLRRAVSALEKTGADFVFGDLLMHAADGRPDHMLLGEDDYARRLRHSMPHVNHPTIVCRREVYEKHGLFDTRLSTAMDYEWLLRGHTQGVRGVYVPGLLIHMSMAGKSHRHARRGFEEVRAVSMAYGYPAMLAWGRFVLRCGKMTLRGMLEKLLPQEAVQRLRRLVNAHYKGVGLVTAKTHARE